ncbi:MAG: hypothetical protein ACI9GW_003277, partial [Halieaceae bacterium]
MACGELATKYPQIKRYWNFGGEIIHVYPIEVNLCWVLVLAIMSQRAVDVVGTKMAVSETSCRTGLTILIPISYDVRLRIQQELILKLVRAVLDQ